MSRHIKCLEPGSGLAGGRGCSVSISIATYERLDVLSNPADDPPTSKLTLTHRAVSKLESVQVDEVREKPLRRKKTRRRLKRCAYCHRHSRDYCEETPSARACFLLPRVGFTWKSGFSKPRQNGRKSLALQGPRRAEARFSSSIVDAVRNGRSFTLILCWQELSPVL